MLVVALLGYLIAAGISLAPFRLPASHEHKACRSPILTIGEELTVRAPTMIVGSVEEQRVRSACSRFGGTRLQIAGVIAGLTFVGMVGSLLILRESKARE
jgi:hypothetical protein